MNSNDWALDCFCYLPRGLHDAVVETADILRSDPQRSFADPTLPIYRYDARTQLEGERQRFERGERMALLAAIRICANHDIPLPAWASQAYIRSYDQVLNCKLDSWDAAFGRPYGKGKKIQALRKRRYLRHRVWLRIVEIRREEKDSRGKPPAIGNELFDRIATEFHTNRDLISKLYRSERDRHASFEQL